MGTVVESGVIILYLLLFISLDLPLLLEPLLEELFVVNILSAFSVCVSQSNYNNSL